VLARAFPGWVRALVGVLAAMIGVGVVVPAALGRAAASSGKDKLAVRLIRLDPGARRGGNTQVATAVGARLVGVPGRVNYMIGLGPREVIVGGAGHDELGALGAGARIDGGGGPDLIHGGPGNDRIHGGPGNDLIYGGPGNDVIDGGPGNDTIFGGPGNDQIIDKQGATTVFPGPGTNAVDVADGQGDDRVMCASGSIDHIQADPGDQIAPSCRRLRSSVRYRQAETGSPPAHAAQVGGSGTNGDPWTPECDDPGDVDCTVSAFPARTLKGLWANEYVPSYECPQLDHPYLLGVNYAPAGTTLIDGVSVIGLGPIGVSMTTALFTEPLALGTETGGIWSSATNWTIGTASYQVVLHCTSDATQGWSPA